MNGGLDLSTDSNLHFHSLSLSLLLTLLDNTFELFSLRAWAHRAVVAAGVRATEMIFAFSSQPEAFFVFFSLNNYHQHDQFLCLICSRHGADVALLTVPVHSLYGDDCGKCEIVHGSEQRRESG